MNSAGEKKKIPFFPLSLFSSLSRSLPFSPCLASVHGGKAQLSLFQVPSVASGEDCSLLSDLEARASTLSKRAVGCELCINRILKGPTTLTTTTTKVDDDDARRPPSITSAVAGTFLRLFSRISLVRCRLTDLNRSADGCERTEPTPDTARLAAVFLLSQSPIHSSSANEASSSQLFFFTLFSPLSSSLPFPPFLSPPLSPSLPSPASFSRT